ncbi:hypothetical protein IU459_16300 [Nocardia amamiensis]|uniref:ESX-1 secretion-associated protein n=1 Tax=Nocardia amamiensis TaxID=404578 RepID=A0ABS0CR68_9NOCA|nr:hypothetical protein [Nocardia amamiensis]MBF6299092.1 hypothetical protein [Nocardia amamiensis]
MPLASSNYNATPIEVKTVPELGQYLGGKDLDQRRITNEDFVSDINTRALWAADTLLHYAKRVGDNQEIETALVDLFADLQHLTTALGKDSQAILAKATRHVEAEAAGER